MDPAALETDAASFAASARKYDTEGKSDTAIFFYMEAAQAMLNALAAGSRTENLKGKAHQYIQRAEVLKSSSNRRGSITLQDKEFCEVQSTIARAQYLVREAFVEDEKGNKEEAIELYSSAVNLLLPLRATNIDIGTKEKVLKLAKQALDRAEILKDWVTRRNESPDQKLPNVKTPDNTYDMKPSPSNRTVDSLGARGGGGYTADELKVLMATSKINGRQYLPFIGAFDLKEKFALPKPFTDTDGLLALSTKQDAKLDRWVRPSDFLDSPKMIMAISCFSIRQTVVTDCSFVASMAIAAQYERRFKKRLITNAIYPQHKGEATYNPCGRYMVRLYINGLPRKVIIDDLLPLGLNGELLCSYSNNRSELWVSLLEKAYMKVMGGYDFPGSNSNIDLHALTGWIPERIAIRSNSGHFNKGREFRRLSSRFHRGHCLITVATGQLEEAEAERAGLVPTHAYAVLDVREVDGKQLFLLKNPWSHLRWKGNFSELDTRNWTPALQAKLNFDQSAAQQIDNGVFWIDYDSLCRYFDVFYVNWNPELFQHTTCVHDHWLAAIGPKKDVYSVSNNPQYRLEVRANVESSIWILLTRHITDKRDFAENREFIAVVVYKDVASRKVYRPYDPEPHRDSVRINSPHCLVQMVQEKGYATYILMISQYEKSNDIYYTLRVYSTAPFNLSRISDPYKFEQTVTGQWKGVNAGGCRNNPDLFVNNPAVDIQLPNNDGDNQLLIELRGPKDFNLGCELQRVSANNPLAPNQEERHTSGDYRRGYTFLELAGLSGGVYRLVVSTFTSGQEGPFILSIKSLRQFQAQLV